MTFTEIASIETKAGPLLVCKGHTPWAVGQLVVKSDTPRLTAPDAVPRDHRERFASAQTFEDWCARGGGASTYFAIDENRRRHNGDPEVAGLVWLRNAAFPDNGDYTPLPGVHATHTYAVRTYGLEGGAEYGDAELEKFYEKKGGTRQLSKIATADYADHAMVPQAVQLAGEGRQPGVHLETDEYNPARKGLYPHMFGPNKGYTEVGIHYDEKHGLNRIGMVLPFDVIAASGLMQTM